MYESGFMEKFRNSLFTRIVPIVKDIGLWGETIRKGYEEMGVIEYAEVGRAGPAGRGRIHRPHLRCAPGRDQTRDRPGPGGGVVHAAVQHV